MSGTKSRRPKVFGRNTPGPDYGVRRQPQRCCLTWMSSILGAQNDTRHLRILELLMQHELCVTQLAEALQLHQYEASRILAFLRHAGIVDNRRDGKWIHYSVSKCLREDAFARSLLKAIHRQIIASGEMAEDFARLEKCLTLHATKAGARPRPA